MSDPPYVQDLFDALEDLIERVRNHIPVLPSSVESSLALGDYVLARAQMERNKNDTN